MMRERAAVAPAEGRGMFRCCKSNPCGGEEGRAVPSRLGRRGREKRTIFCYFVRCVTYSIFSLGYSDRTLVPAL